MVQFAMMAIFILGILGQFSNTQSAGLPSSAISPYNDMGLPSGLTSTSITTQKTVLLLHQILLQETSLKDESRESLNCQGFDERTRTDEETLSGSKKEQYIINKQLIGNIASLRSENQQLKDEPNWDNCKQ